MFGRLCAFWFTSTLATTFFDLTFSTTFYISSDSGNDTYDGTTFKTAWRTLGRLSTPAHSPVRPGDQVRLARGSVWRESLDAVGGNVTAVVTYGNYGDPTLAKPMLVGSASLGASINWKSVPGRSGLWQTLPATYAPASGAVNGINNPYLRDERADWGFWTPAVYSPHVSWSISRDVPPSTDFDLNLSLAITWTNMDHAPPATDPVQLWNANISVVAGKTYNFSYWAKSTAAINASGIRLMAMSPPYEPYASGSDAGVSFSGGNAWKKFATSFTATVSANDGRVGWFWDSPWCGPSNATLWIANVSLLETVRTNPNVTTFDVDVGNLLFFHKDQDAIRDEPAATGWKKWSVADIQNDGDFYFDPDTKLLSLQCTTGEPSTCWPGGIEGALDSTQISLHSYSVIDGIAVRFGASLGMNGAMLETVIVKNCDVSWVGGGVLTYDYPGRSDPVRYGNGIQFWNGASDISVFNNRVWQMYDTPVTNQGIDCTKSSDRDACAMRNISFHHNLLSTSGMACVEIWYQDANATMSEVRFENNICANIGDAAWSAAQRPDAAGRGLCVYENSAVTTNVSVKNNIFFQNAGFEALIYISQTWDAWAAQGLTFENNALFRTKDLPPSPAPHQHDEGSEHWLIKTKEFRVTSANFSAFVNATTAGKNTVMSDPMLHGLNPSNGWPVSMLDNVTNCRPCLGSPLLNAGARVQWLSDFAGASIPSIDPTIGPYQTPMQTL